MRRAEKSKKSPTHASKKKSKLLVSFTSENIPAGHYLFLSLSCFSYNQLVIDWAEKRKKQRDTFRL
jgi:hypothetical protein